MTQFYLGASRNTSEEVHMAPFQDKKGNKASKESRLPQSSLRKTDYLIKDVSNFKDAIVKRSPRDPG